MSRRLVATLGVAGAAALAACMLVASRSGRDEDGTLRGLRQLQEVRQIIVTYVMDPVTGHKELWPIDVSDVLGLSAAVLGLMIAAGGGIGGGGMLVPIFVLVMGFGPKYAIPLSNMTVLGGAITNVSMNALKRHPVAERSLVDWDLLIMMEPLTLAGALLGGIVNKLAPELLIVVLLVLTLAVTSDKTLRKGMKLYAKESEAQSASSELRNMDKSEAEATQREEEASLLDENNDAAKKLSAEDAALLEAILAEERESFPVWKIAVLLSMTALIIAINLAKGGGEFPSPLGIECGTTQYWLTTAAMFVYLITISLWVRDYLVKRTADKIRLGYAFVEGDIIWDASSTIKYPCVCFFAGMCAGLFGIGGGIINGPLMLELGVLPGVAGATTAPMILLTASAAATTFYTFGLVQFDYASNLFFVGLAATLIGQLGMGYLIKKSGRQSYVAFSIGAVVTISTVLMGMHGVLSLTADATDELVDAAPKSFCGKG